MLSKLPVLQAVNTWRPNFRTLTITPLPNGKTRAHNLYEIYEHGDEKQVDFLRDTSFMVTKVEETKGTPYRKYYLKELSDA